MDNNIKEAQGLAEKIIQNVEKVMVGKTEVVRLAVIALISQGHLLIEDAPGVGKTMLARSLAKSINCTFKRIQFTPDMLPGDVTGVTVYNQKSGDFEFRSGPISAQVVLADEINRATPKTQAALLEAMEERTVTVDGVTHQLPRPFMVLATQNPIEYEGTFPLPEAQVDRFMMRVRLGYPGSEDEINVLERQQYQHPFEVLDQVVSLEELVAAQQAVKGIFVSNPVKRYIVGLVHQTRIHEEVYLGASPRGSLALFRTAQARAAMLGRDYVLPDDIKVLAVPTLAHRVILGPGARLRDLNASQIVEEILNSVAVPGGDPTAMMETRSQAKEQDAPAESAA